MTSEGPMSGDAITRSNSGFQHVATTIRSGYVSIPPTLHPINRELPANTKMNPQVRIVHWFAWIPISPVCSLAHQGGPDVVLVVWSSQSGDVEDGSGHAW